MSPDPITMRAYSRRALLTECIAVFLLALLVLGALAWPDLLAWFHGLPPVGAP